MCVCVCVCVCVERHGMLVFHTRNDVCRACVLCLVFVFEAFLFDLVSPARCILWD